jgi:hypothetical protein
VDHFFCVNSRFCAFSKANLVVCFFYKIPSYENIMGEKTRAGKDLD